MTDDDEWYERRRAVLNNRKNLGFYPNVDGRADRHGPQWRRRPVTYKTAPDVAWQSHAACKGLTDLFYADNDERNDEALHACFGCPVMWPCRYAALDDEHQPFGVQGGLSVDARTQIRRSWRQIDATVMRERRAEAVRESWTLRGIPHANTTTPHRHRQAKLDMTNQRELQSA